MDPVADMLNQIKNAQMALHPKAFSPFSNLKCEILKILEMQGFIGPVEKKGKGVKKTLEISLKYDNEQDAQYIGRPARYNKTPALSGFKKISKPSQKIYLSAKQIKFVNKGRSVVIISTSKGLMTLFEAKKKGLGGEVLCEVW